MCPNRWLAAPSRNKVFSASLESPYAKQIREPSVLSFEAFAANLVRHVNHETAKTNSVGLGVFEHYFVQMGPSCSKAG
jgi:hypothetical protein